MRFDARRDTITSDLTNTSAYGAMMQHRQVEET
jgi:hypothetical protein